MSEFSQIKLLNLHFRLFSICLSFTFSTLTIQCFAFLKKFSILTFSFQKHNNNKQQTTKDHESEIHPQPGIGRHSQQRIRRPRTSGFIRHKLLPGL